MTDTPSQEQGQPQVAAPTPASPHSKARTTWAIVLLAGPSALWIVVFILNIINNYVWATTMTDLSTSSLYLEENMVHLTITVLAWILGVIAFLSWLPGLIIGIVLLATKK